MPPPPDVTMQEVDDAFYRSYGEGTPKGLDPRLINPRTKKRRKLSLGAADSRFRECWMETRRLLREEKGCAPPPKGVSTVKPIVSCPGPATNPDRPAYKPTDWNDGGAIQGSTNCYAYAMDSRLGHPPGRPQPGEKSGTTLSSPVTCPGVTNAVIDDGKPDNIMDVPRCPYTEQEKKPPPDKKGYYLVALVVTSKPEGYDAKDGVYYINDYHWYRQDEDGSWSHKPGNDEVRNVDSNKMPITNPETAGRRTVYGDPGDLQYIPAIKKSVPLAIDYDVFCGYFYVKKGGVTIGK